MAHGNPPLESSKAWERSIEYMPLVGGTFLQAESEVAAINIMYGAASAGIRAMTASSGPGLSLMQEGMSYLAGAELPCVVVDVVRGGPGLGNIAPEQSDYFAVVAAEIWAKESFAERSRQPFSARARRVYLGYTATLAVSEDQSDCSAADRSSIHGQRTVGAYGRSGRTAVRRAAAISECGQRIFLSR